MLLREEKLLKWSRLPWRVHSRASLSVDASNNPLIETSAQDFDWQCAAWCGGVRQNGHVWAFATALDVLLLSGFSCLLVLELHHHLSFFFVLFLCMSVYCVIATARFRNTLQLQLLSNYDYNCHLLKRKRAAGSPDCGCVFLFLFWRYLMELVERHGQQCWYLIATFLTARICKQCRKI